MKGWSLSNAFSKPRWLCFSPCSINVVCYTDFLTLNHHCTPGTNPPWSWCIIFLICGWIWFASILLKMFAFIFTRYIGRKRHYLVMSLSGFGIRAMLASQKRIGKHVFLLLCFQSLWISTISSLNAWYNSNKPCQAIWARDFFAETFLITNSISLL